MEKLVKATACIGNSNMPLFMHFMKVTCTIAAQSLECFPLFELPRDDESVIAFHEMFGPENFVKACSALLKGIGHVVAQPHEQWIDFSNQELPTLLKACLTSLLELPSQNLPRKCELLSSIMEFVIHNFQPNSQCECTLTEVYQLMIRDNSFLKSFFVPESPNNQPQIEDTYWYQVIRSFSFHPHPFLDCSLSGYLYQKCRLRCAHFCSQ